MANPTYASTAMLRTMTAIAVSSMVKSRLDAMHHFLRQSSGGVDLDQARLLGRWSGSQGAGAGTCGCAHRGMKPRALDYGRVCDAVHSVRRCCSTSSMFPMNLTMIGTNRGAC